ncbi:MAG: nickel pincer cofactor biosynthesis protein LarC [Fibrobacterota bacterium]
MKKILHFDLQGGVSGDMLAGAFLDLGVPLKILREAVKSAGTKKISISAKKVNRNSTACTKAVIKTAAEHKHRHLSEIEKIISKTGLAPDIKETAVLIFREIARAEAFVHNTTPQKIHFHEVGALDAIADVLCTSAAVSYLKPDALSFTPFYLGTGTVKCAHGLMPVPVPAVCEIIKGDKAVRTGVSGELTTPTGAACIKILKKKFPVYSGEFEFTGTGLGAGDKEYEGSVNYLRIISGGTPDKAESVLLIETNIDDDSPEILSYTMKKLFDAGALDVYFTPATMKKCRPGVVLSVICDSGQRDLMAEIMFRETGTAGLRYRECSRIKLGIEIVKVKTRYGTLKAKALLNGKSRRIIPEFSECEKIASKHSIPLHEIYKEVYLSNKHQNFCLD